MDKIRMFLFFLGVCIIPIYLICYYQTEEEITITVTDKERVHNGNSSKYLIFTKNETFSNKDMLWKWKWNSSDIYGKIKRNQTYKIKVYGWRIKFLSTYRNIYSIKKVKKQQASIHSENISGISRKLISTL